MLAWSIPFLDLLISLRAHSESVGVPRSSYSPTKKVIGRVGEILVKSIIGGSLTP